MNVQLRWLETDDWVPQLCEFRRVLQYRVYGIQPDGSVLPSWSEWRDVPVVRHVDEEAADDA